jgi:hypothetical protein
MSAAQTLSHNTLERIRQRFNMGEVQNIPLNSAMGPVGVLRVFANGVSTNGVIPKMVYVRMTVEQFGLDSHMIFAFTSPDSPIPHFTLDSVLNAPDFAFHVDLIPRVDLGANLEYLNAVFHPLTEEYQRVQKIEGLTPARLLPHQYAIMSPWMLVSRANLAAFEQIEGAVNHYLDHWFGLVGNGLPQGVLDTLDLSALAERDRKNRAAIFNPVVDPVWAQVDRLLGAETSAYLREVLKSPQVEVKA